MVKPNQIIRRFFLSMGKTIVVLVSDHDDIRVIPSSFNVTVRNIDNGEEPIGVDDIPPDCHGVVSKTNGNYGVSYIKPSYTIIIKNYSNQDNKSTNTEISKLDKCLTYLKIFQDEYTHTGEVNRLCLLLISEVRKIVKTIPKDASVISIFETMEREIQKIAPMEEAFESKNSNTTLLEVYENMDNLNNGTDDLTFVIKNLQVPGGFRPVTLTPDNIIRLMDALIAYSISRGLI